MQEDSAKTGAQGPGWPELSAGVQEEVIQLMSNVNKANEKVSYHCLLNVIGSLMRHQISFFEQNGPNVIDHTVS